MRRLLLLLSACGAVSVGLVAAAQGEAEPNPLVLPPACEYLDEPAPLAAYDLWWATVLDTRLALDAAYAPPDLQPVVTAFPSDYPQPGEHQLRAVVIDDLRAMIAAAVADGVMLAVQSAYRSHQYQAATFEYWASRQGEEAARLSSARAGHSEHQLGTAVDFRSLAGPPAWELDDWALTPEGAWMTANAWRYGFVMSYPKGQTELSCYAYEPWHYRYLGRELAAEVHAGGLVPRVVLWSRANQILAEKEADHGD